MSLPSNQTALRAPAPELQRSSVSDIDVSCRLPLLVLFLSAASWLVIGWIFQLIASIKFHNPNFLADCSSLTYGRVHPAFTNSVLYGFGLQAGLGVTLWLLAQMGGVRLVNGWLATIGAITLNLGVTVGLIGILAGDSTGFEYLEMPGYASVLVLIGYLFIALWGVVTFHRRRKRRLVAAHWFLLTALFWFPWISSTANLLLVTFPVRGMAQAVIAWWYAQNFLVVWMALVGLGAVFSLIPRFTGRELHNHYTALFAYWILILFGSWGGIPNSASVPAWLPAISTVGTVLSLLAFIAAPLTVYQSLECSWEGARGNISIAFFVFATAAFALTGFARAGMSLVDSSHALHLTWLAPAVAELTFYGFFGMVLFGAIYIIVPQVLGVALPSTKLIRTQLWLSVAGLVLIVLPFAIAGIVQDAKLNDAHVPFVEIIRSSLHFLRVSTLGDLLLVGAHLLLLGNLARMVVNFYRARAVATYAELTHDLFKPAGAKP
jgi:cytochrome c oxidase cbb3-type subunit 1